ncbi:hypothetical protein LOCC1_G006167 [Lachnellula occidentalis]|uniref:Uncharacterized protein n=1 Tax=Lachnellula occidentalis TaxID=215460 RepID=A0A8H8S206_9HELO|nr:hypothetical protein LOCC1_G006167 [Lachnellula occidentalis]
MLRECLERVIIRDANLPPSINEYSEVFAGYIRAILIDIFSGYDNQVLYKKSRNIMAFFTPIRLVRNTRLLIGVTNSVA